MLSNPRLLFDGVDLTGGAGDPVAALADLSITWGTPSLVEPPTPDTLKVTLVYTGSVDVLRLRQGMALDLVQDFPDDDRFPFSGRIRSMSSRVDGKGRLNISITATDHLADLDSTYVSTAWHTDGYTEAQGRTYRQNLTSAIAAQGWQLFGMERLPAEVRRSAATFYNSIKITTLLRRYLAQWGPNARYFDASYRSDGRLIRRITVAHMADSSGGDTLTVGAGGTWYMKYGSPVGAQTVTVPASNVLRDIEWESAPENLLTVAQVSYQSTRREEREDGSTQWVTSLGEVNTTRGAEWVDQYGARSVEVETTLAESDATLLRQIGQRWMQFNGDEWRAESVTIHDSTQLPVQVLSDMIGKSTRPRQWIVVHGAEARTPRGELASLRGLATGGELSWDHDKQRWSISVHLTDTRLSEDRVWNFLGLGLVPISGIAVARATNAGPVRFSDFATITDLDGGTP